ncbi:MAG: hypothetical protein JXA89_27465 [Anaerolineae bacterium]|nr:hypothetical protein [Anaerolineae bacterium]
MNRERLFWIVLFTLLLVGGMLIGQNTRRKSASSAELDADSFRIWFWQNRTLDLIVQVGLIFGGALGIAALLPGERENQ